MVGVVAWAWSSCWARCCNVLWSRSLRPGSRTRRTSSRFSPRTGATSWTSVSWSRTSKHPGFFFGEDGSRGAVLRRYGGSWANSTHFLRARAVLTGNPGHYFDELLVSGNSTHFLREGELRSGGRNPRAARTWKPGHCFK